MTPPFLSFPIAIARAPVVMRERGWGAQRTMTIIIAGTSGQHATVVYEAAVLSGIAITGFMTVGDAAIPSILDCPYLGPLFATGGGDALPPDYAQHRFIIATGDNRFRRTVSERIQRLGAALQSIIHPSAILSPSARIDDGAMVLAGAIIGPRAVIGQSVIVNHAASVDHDCHVGDYGNICPGARLGGSVHAETGVFVGMNAVILPGLHLGTDCIIGAGAVVTADAPAQSCMVGVPARRR